MSDGAETTDGAPADRDAALRDHLLTLLAGNIAHLDFDKATRAVPAEHRGTRPDGLEHSPWELLEHLRFTQRDILDFCTDPNYEAPPWPEGYWPDGLTPPDAGSWDRALAAYREDHDAFRALIEDRDNDLFAPIPWGDGQTLVKEAFLVADHAGYHLAQIVDARRILGCWPPPEDD